MGQAKRRGTYEERVRQAQERDLERVRTLPAMESTPLKRGVNERVVGGHPHLIMAMMATLAALGQPQIVRMKT